MRILSTRGTVFGLAVLALCLLSSARAAISLTVGTNINITRTSGNNAEECIAINPRNPLNLFMSETWSLVTKYSTDGGVTWQNSNVSALGSSIGDVSAAFDAFGNLFLVRFGSNLRIVVGLSTDGGATFSSLFTSTSNNNDQPTITTGPSPVAGQGCVWITYTDSANRLVAQGATVTALGAVGAFSAAQFSPVGGDFGDIVVGPAGQMAVTYQNNSSGVGPDIIRYALDADGTGPSGFGPVVNATSTQVGGFAAIPAQPSRTIDAEAGLAWDRSGGPFNGRLYLLYTDRPSTASNDTDIYVRYSNDNGTNWSAPVRVNDDTPGNGASQFLPKIALDQTSGYLAASWYDCRNSPGNNTAEVWATISTDGGQTFLPNVKVSTGMSSAIVAAVGSFNFGDYSGLAFHGGTFYPCWADNSNSTGDNPGGTLGTFDIYTARVTVNTLTLPAIQTPPQTQTAEAGTAVEFSVEATPVGNLGYQWYFNGTNELGSTSSVLQLSSVQYAQAGAYTVLVTNAAGAVTSPPALLNVIAPLERRMVPALNLTGQPGAILNLDFTPVLAPAPLWTTFDHVPLIQNTRWYFDLSSPLPPQRFYRAWQFTPGAPPVLNLNFVPALTLTGPVGSTQRVDYINQFGPTNAWVTLATVTLTNTTQLYFDTSAIGQPPRLWRVVTVP